MIVWLKVWLVNHRFIKVRCTHDDRWDESSRCYAKADSAYYWDGKARFSCGYCRYEC